MFDPNGPFDRELCDEILLAVCNKRKATKPQDKAKISRLAEEFGYDKTEVKNNAEYLIMIGHLSSGLGGYLKLTREGAVVVTELLENL